MSSEIEGILSSVNTYLDALYNGDTDLFKTVLHPQVQLSSGTESTLVTMNREQYMDVVSNRPSPASRGDQRRDIIDSITRSSPTSGHARVRNTYAPKRFVDDLILVLNDGHWWIISKTWHYTLNEERSVLGTSGDTAETSAH
ncbi:nuclear transport factor 2 family protein [Micrococcaceae bacterium Sec5.1]